MADTSLSRSTAPVADPPIPEPDPDEEYQASNATTPSEIDLQVWRHEFTEEILKWTKKRGCPDKRAILTMIQFLPDVPIAKESLDASQRRYERLCSSHHEIGSEPFPIVGKPETEQFDRLKCWVHFNLHLMHGRWPDGYEPISPPGELEQLEEDDDKSTVYEVQSVADSQAFSGMD